MWAFLYQLALQIGHGAGEAWVGCRGRPYQRSPVVVNVADGPGRPAVGVGIEPPCVDCGQPQVKDRLRQTQRLRIDVLMRTRARTEDFADRIQIREPVLHGGLENRPLSPLVPSFDKHDLILAHIVARFRKRIREQLGGRCR